MSADPLDALRATVAKAAHKLQQLRQERGDLAARVADLEAELAEARAEIQRLRRQGRAEHDEVQRRRHYDDERQMVRERLSGLLDRLDSLEMTAAGERSG